MVIHPDSWWYISMCTKRDETTNQHFDRYSQPASMANKSAEAELGNRS